MGIGASADTGSGGGGGSLTLKERLRIWSAKSPDPWKNPLPVEKDGDYHEILRLLRDITAEREQEKALGLHDEAWADAIATSEEG